MKLKIKSQYRKNSYGSLLYDMPLGNDWIITKTPFCIKLPSENREVLSGGQSGLIR